MHVVQLNQHAIGNSVTPTLVQPTQPGQARCDGAGGGVRQGIAALDGEALQLRASANKRDKPGLSALVAATEVERAEGTAMGAERAEGFIGYGFAALTHVEVRERRAAFGELAKTHLTHRGTLAKPEMVQGGLASISAASVRECQQRLVSRTGAA